jgi:hypothetical protein
MPQCAQYNISPHLRKRERDFVLNVMSHSNLSFLENVSLGNPKEMLTVFTLLFSKKFLHHTNEATTFVTDRWIERKKINYILFQKQKIKQIAEQLTRHPY